IMLTSVVLPAPEGPNTAVTPDAVSNCAAIENSPSCFSTSTASIYSPWKRMPARRASHSDSTSATSESTIATTTSRPAAASPPGGGVAARHLRERIDRGRECLGLARDVGHEGDGGAELAERLGEAQHETGDQPWQCQRQRHGEEHTRPIGAERRSGIFEPPVD